MRPGKSLLAALAAMFLATASHAAVLLTIDLSDPAAVTITATGSFASTNSTTTLVSQGISLVGFFTRGVESLSQSASTSSLLASGASGAYNQIQSDPDLSLGDIDPVTGQPKKNNLNLFNSTSDSEQDFETASAAFSGALTVDLSSLADALPANGASGTIMSGNAEAAGPDIGTWRVVPEPSPFALSGAALLLGLLHLWKSRATRMA